MWVPLSLDELIRGSWELETSDQESSLPHNDYIDFAHKDTVWMQFTGLKDNNGNEIYHKDIFVLSDRVGEVEWERDRWVVQFKDYNVSLFDFIFNDKGRTVSGNIYENPDLIK